MCFHWQGILQFGWIGVQIFLRFRAGTGADEASDLRKERHGSRKHSLFGLSIIGTILLALASYEFLRSTFCD